MVYSFPLRIRSSFYCSEGALGRGHVGRAIVVQSLISCILEDKKFNCLGAQIAVLDPCRWLVLSRPA